MSVLYVQHSGSKVIVFGMSEIIALKTAGKSKVSSGLAGQARSYSWLARLRKLAQPYLHLHIVHFFFILATSVCLC